MAAHNNESENKVNEDKVIDDNQVILDNRGFLKVGNWYVKIRRINVREMIAGWGVISQAFTQVKDLDLNWKTSEPWIMLFLVALPVAPGKFYQFLCQVMELQNNSHDLPDEEFFKKETAKYNDYIRKDLATEELIQAINIVYDQEKDRFGELAKQVDFLMKPLLNNLKADSKKIQPEK